MINGGRLEVGYDYGIIWVELQWVLYRFTSLVNSIESYFVCYFRVVLFLAMDLL